MRQRTLLKWPEEDKDDTEDILIRKYNQPPSLGRIGDPCLGFTINYDQSR